MSIIYCEKCQKYIDTDLDTQETTSRKYRVDNWKLTSMLKDYGSQGISIH